MLVVIHLSSRPISALLCPPALFLGVCGVGEVEEEWEGGSAGLSMLILLASLVFSPLVVFDQG